MHTLMRLCTCKLIHTHDYMIMQPRNAARSSQDSSRRPAGASRDDCTSKKVLNLPLPYLPSHSLLHPSTHLPFCENMGCVAKICNLYCTIQQSSSKHMNDLFFTTKFHYFNTFYSPQVFNEDSRIKEIVLGSCIVDFDEVQVSLRALSLSLNI
jgi:hypothetical protein